MQTTTFSERVKSGRAVVVDGGLVTQLRAQGIEPDGVLWCAALLLENPSAVIQAHRAYLDAGAEVVISASYQASRAGFHQVGVGADEADRLIASSVALARDAVDAFADDHPKRPRRYVAASVGPYGAVLNDGSEYRGDYGVSRGVLREFHSRRLQVLDAAGADVLACETLPSGDEARVLGELLEASHTPAWMSFSCRDDSRLCDGTPIADLCATLADHPGIVALGVNCTAPQHVDGLIARVRSAAPDKAVIVYPNSGERYDAAANTWHGEVTLDDVGALARRWHHAGATLIGGCCRLGAGHIEAIAAALQATDS
ncbi:MAG: homocysteine S-methyltransferase [Woeseiaceae bacterium]|nr:homocysteine S-methyltransferase [Woeseiaceae bacterium]